MGVALTLSSVPAVLERIASARDVAFGSYFLPPGPVRDALVGAARRGAHVDVTLQADPYRNPYGERANADAARALRDAGAGVTLFASDRVPFHLKAAVCDGTAYLDDRNWTKRGPEIVIADDTPGDVALVRDALRGHGGASPTLATRKDVGLQREVALVDGAGPQPVTAESERVSTSPLTRALQRRALRGEPSTLIASGTHRPRREAHALALLKADGVRVRSGGTNEKLALAGDRAWIGSGNATGASGRTARQLEWAVVTGDPAIVAAARSALARDVR